MPPGEAGASSSGPSGASSFGAALFGPLFTTDDLAEATSDRAWVAGMLAFEAALATAEAEVGLVPRDAAAAIARCCREVDIDPGALGRPGRLGASPVIPFVSELRRRLPVDAEGWVHFGATSQDVLDTALMLVLRRVMDLVLADLGRLARAAAALAKEHRSTLIAARTLLQQAAPTTFGRKAAGWLVAVTEVSGTLRDARRNRLAVQLGGPAGTLASLGESGPRVVELVASELGLEVPVLPWHTDRTRVGEVSCALALCAGAAGKVALDVSLMMQTEVSEAFEPSAAGRGTSSSLPHKRNPAMAAEVLAACRRAEALAGLVLSGMVQEHERAVGAWQAEWQTVPELARAAGGSVSFAADMLTGLEVDPVRMAQNLAGTGGLVLAERLTTELTPLIGYPEARRSVEAASRQVTLAGISLEEALAREPVVAEVLPRLPRGVFEPAGWLGSSEAFVDRALELYHKAFGDG